MLIGYLMNKAADADTLAAQRQALADAGYTLVVEDLGDGSRWEQPELRRLLDGLREGDVMILPTLGCLGRSLPDVVRQVGRIATAGAGLRSLAEALDTTTPEGRAAAHTIGTWRRPKLTRRQRAAIAEEVLSGRRTGAQMAKLHKVSAPTVSQVVAAHRAGARRSRQ